MEPLHIKYSSRTAEPPPRAIRMADVDWAGSTDLKMVDGSEVQPWHCLPFIEGSTYGLELIYPWETECHVVGRNGTIEFEWDFAKEPGGILAGGEFRAFSPNRAAQYYSLATMLAVVPPPGYVLRSEPHPRFFTDTTGTVPLCLIGHLQNEWYPRRVFLVFKAPRQGDRHIFRKGEPYAQLLVVPQRVKYELTPLTPEEEAQHRQFEREINFARLEIADNIWTNPDGSSFSNHYKVMARAFARDGVAGVKEVVQKALDRIASRFPTGKPSAECLEIGTSLIENRKFEQAEVIFRYVIERDPYNTDRASAAKAYHSLAYCLSVAGNLQGALDALVKARDLLPNSPFTHKSLAGLLGQMRRLAEAEASFRAALELSPNDVELWMYLGMTQSDQGRIADARASFTQAALLDPSFAPARQALQRLPNDNR